MPHKPLRSTRQRTAILDYLRHTTSHPTAEKVHSVVRREIPTIGLATVYRNLETLVERGMAIRFDGPDGRRHYDANTRIHYHIFCTQCGRVADLHVEEPRVDLERLQEATDFQVTGFDLTLRGICPKCREAGGGERRRGRRASPKNQKKGERRCRSKAPRRKRTS